MCNARMEDDDIRRKVLRALIKAEFNDTANQYAIAVEKPPGQINDMLATPPRKAFGARVARSMEKKLGLPRLFFEDLNNAKALDEYSKVNGDEKISTPPKNNACEPPAKVLRFGSPLRAELDDIADTISDSGLRALIALAMEVAKQFPRDDTGNAARSLT